MYYKKVNSLYGLKVNDRVQIISYNNELYGDSNFLNLFGTINNIVAETGEFRVLVDTFTIPVSFQRIYLRLASEKEREKVDFSGILFDNENLTLEEMVSYLDKYHNLIEGKDFAISNREGVNEIILTNNKYCSLLQDMIALQEVNKELELSSYKNIVYNIKRDIGEASSLSFFIAGWTFRTHLTPFTIQHAFLSMYGINSYKELNIQTD